MMEFKHTSVLLEETIEALDIKPDGIYVDCTLGGGGHSFEIAKRLVDGGRLIGIDRDSEAIEAASKRLEPYKDRVTIIKDTYEHLFILLRRLEVEAVDGILLDLGVSSHQFDDPQRGFSYRDPDAPLDMRMDREDSLSARDVINTYDKAELARIFREYGEEKFAQNIASHIVKRRAQKPIETTGEFTEVIKAAIPAKIRTKKAHPEARVFQAVRIELNRELTQLSESLEGMIDILNPGGVLAVITFHSLEDRIVKEKFKTAQNPCICPPEFPMCTCGRKAKGLASRKPITASEEELEKNPRAHSAKLRVFKRAEIK